MLGYYELSDLHRYTVSMDTVTDKRISESHIIRNDKKYYITTDTNGEMQVSAEIFEEYEKGDNVYLVIIDHHVRQWYDASKYVYERVDS